MVSSPSFAVIILVNDGIAFVSEGGKKVLGEAGENIIGRNIYTFFDKEDRKTARHRIKYILNNKIEDISHEYSILVGDNRRIDLELSSGYFLYNNSEAIRVEIRNISRIKKELKIAAKYQKASLQKKFPIEGKVKMERIFLPCKIVSGDFYKIHKIDENNVVGIIWDATGKGLSAALNVNVLEFLFAQIVQKSKKPLEVINMLNKKIMENFEENYIAACCFSFDFKSKQVNVVGAGINQFLMQKRNGIVEEVEVKGTPLGMFSNSYFSEKTFSIESGDRFFFFTDGLEFLLDTDKVIQRYMGKVSIKDIKKFLAQYTDELLFSTEGLKDDCTMLALEILDGF